MPLNNIRILRRQILIILVLLIIQYALGMYANLYVQFPDSISGGPAWEFAWTQLPVALHIVNAFLLYIIGITFLVTARRHDKTLVKYAVWGLIGITLAAVSGALFIPLQNDIFSYGMSLFFIIAFIAYIGGLYKLRLE